MYDGNIEYLKGKHVPLFAVALVSLVFFILPYTMLLTFGQCVRSISIRKRCVLWCIRSTAFISIMDAYHAPLQKDTSLLDWPYAANTLRSLPYLCLQLQGQQTADKHVYHNSYPYSMQY